MINVSLRMILHFNFFFANNAKIFLHNNTSWQGNASHGAS